MPKPPRSTKIEFEKRLLIIQGWIIDSASTSLMIQQIIKNEWSQSERHAERMIAAARKKWVQHESDDIAERRALKVLELQQLKRSLKDPYKGTPAGIRAIVAIDKEIIKLQGLAAPVKVEHGNKDGQPLEIVHSIKMTDEEIKKISKVLEDEC